MESRASSASSSFKRPCSHISDSAAGNNAVETFGYKDGEGPENKKIKVADSQPKPHSPDVTPKTPTPFATGVVLTTFQPNQYEPHIPAYLVANSNLSVTLHDYFNFIVKPALTAVGNWGNIKEFISQVAAYKKANPHANYTAYSIDIEVLKRLFKFNCFNQIQLECYCKRYGINREEIIPYNPVKPIDANVSSNNGVSEITVNQNNPLNLPVNADVNTQIPISDNQIFKVSEKIRGKNQYPIESIRECKILKHTLQRLFSSAVYFHTLLDEKKGNSDRSFIEAVRNCDTPCNYDITVRRLNFLSEKGCIGRRNLEVFVKTSKIEDHEGIMRIKLNSTDTNIDTNNDNSSDKNDPEISPSNSESNLTLDDLNQYLTELGFRPEITSEITTPQITEDPHPTISEISDASTSPNPTAEDPDFDTLYKLLNEDPPLENSQERTEEESLPNNTELVTQETEVNNSDSALTQPIQIGSPWVDLSKVKSEPMEMAPEIPAVNIKTKEISWITDDTSPIDAAGKTQEILEINGYETRPVDNSLPPLFTRVQGKIVPLPMPEIKVNFTNLNPQLQVSPTYQKQIKEGIINQIQNYLKLNKEELIKWYAERMTTATSKIPGAGQGVFSVKDLPQFSFLGFYAGELITSDEALLHTLEHHGSKSQFYLFENRQGNTIDPYHGNILSVMNTANLPGHKSDRHNNVQRLPCGNSLFFITTEKVSVGEELYVSYGAQYRAPSY